VSLHDRNEKTTASGLCRLVGMSRQAFYQERRERRKREIDEEAIIEQVKAERRIHPRIGTRKLGHLIAPELKEMGIEIGRDRLFALLGKKGLLIRRRRRRAWTTDSSHGMRVYRNLVRDLDVTMPNQVWVSDLTYIRTEEGFLYLSLITDAYSRKIVGFDIDDSLEANGCVRALEMALKSLPEGRHPIHHSDRGIQYCCGQYVERLERCGMAISMTEKNHCYENALAERVNGILKGEYRLGETFRTKGQAIRLTKQVVEIYNELRPHLALNYQTPSCVHAKAA